MGDFTLKSTASDAIDKGSNAYASGGVDLAGNARIGNATVDIGAYEYSISLPTVTLSVDNTTIAETGGSATITAELSAVSTSDVTVTLGYTARPPAAARIIRRRGRRLR